MAPPMTPLKEARAHLELVRRYIDDDEPNWVSVDVAEKALKDALAALTRIEAEGWQPIERAQRQRSPSRDALLKEAADALSDAAAWFREYEKVHAAKRPPDNDKAIRNRARAERLEAVVARLRAQEGGGG